MKKTLILIAFLCASAPLFAQKNWFTLYQDSAKLTNDAIKITADFEKDIKKISPNLEFSVKSVLKTSPYLIYYNNIYKAAFLPIWEQVIPPQKNFFYEVAGSEEEGRKVFGLFFNGFYLPHELGHALQYASKDSAAGLSYRNEYLANTIAMLWWRKHKRDKELKLCYEYAKKVFSKLPNPVPSDMTEEEYFTKNYEQATRNPYVYGYMQFKQFIKIYEDKNLQEFDVFINNYLNK